MTSTSEGTRIVLVGCGRWGRNILRDLLALGCHVEVVDTSPEARAAAVALGAAAAVDRIEAAGPADGFVVATPTVLHAQGVRDLLPSGRPIFCEKPLAPDVDEARDLARQGRGRLFVMEKWRYHGGIEAMGELARSGRYGPLLSLTTRRRQWGTPHSDVDPVWILAPHDVSIVREILGELPPVRHARGVGTAAWLEEIDAVLGEAPSALISVSGISGETERLVRAVFEQAVVTLPDSLADHLEIISRREPGGAVERLPISVDMPLLKELRAFAGFVKGGPPPKTNGDDAVLTVERLAQMRTAALG